MDARGHRRAALAAVFAVAGMEPALAGGHGGGGHPGPMFRPLGGFHGFGGMRGGWSGGMRSRGLPPISGVIHERPGLRPYESAYGHTDTALRTGGPGREGGGFYGHTGTGPRYGGLGPGGGPLYGHTATGLPPGGQDRRVGAGYGHVWTGLRYGGWGRDADRRSGALGDGRRRLVGGRFVGGFGGGYGGFGDGFGAGLYGAPGIYGDAGVYGGQGTYGQAGTSGGTGTYATQSVYGNGGGASYLSGRPLAARFAEPPLAPSPYAPYSPGDRYAYAASEDVGPGPRVLRVHPGSGAGCGCGASPTFYRYGVGTAY